MESGPEQTPEAEAPQGLRGAVGSAWPVWLLAAGVVLLAGGLTAGLLTRPRPDVGAGLDRAERLIERGEYNEAIDRLNAGVMPHVGREWVSDAERGRYHRAVARAVFMGQRELGVSHPDNDETIRRSYVAAEKAGAAISPDDVVRLCETYLSLGLEDLAYNRLAKLDGSASEQRRRIARLMVEHELARQQPDYGRAVDLLVSLGADQQASLEDRAWSLARESEVRLGQGLSGEAASRLLQGVVRLQDAPPGSLAELYVLLGAAYIDLGEHEKAVRQLERATALLGTTEPLMARAQCYLAICEQSVGEHERARDRFASVVRWAFELPWRTPAMLGLAETEGLLGNTEESLAAYEKVVSTLVRGERHPLVAPTRVANSLLGQAEDQLIEGDAEMALRFLVQAEELFGIDDAPPEVVLALARAHQAFAERSLGLEPQDETRTPAPVPSLVAALDPVGRAVVQRHYIASAQYFARHANAAVLADNETYVRSLWASALNFDRGGDYGRAISAFREYIESVPDDSSAVGRMTSQAEARFRLAHAYQAKGDHPLAADTFRSLIDDAAGGAVGQYAQASYVPLARSLLSDGRAENDAEAERLLLEAVSGAVGGVGGQYFHDALLALAELLHRSGQWPRAIGRLREAMDRYPEDPETDMLRYRLADSLRREASAIADTVARQAMPDPQLQALEAQRDSNLREALGLFADVRDTLSALEPGQLDAERRVALRNAEFYLGDCAFDLGDYEAAVRHYETAREHHASDPASLVAMVQIVNCYVAMGQMDRARAADERAKRFFATLPEDAWADPFLPMAREDWERWLDSTSELYGFGGD